MTATLNNNNFTPDSDHSTILGYDSHHSHGDSTMNYLQGIVGGGPGSGGVPNNAMHGAVGNIAGVPNNRIAAAKTSLNNHLDEEMKESWDNLDSVHSKNSTIHSKTQAQENTDTYHNSSSDSSFDFNASTDTFACFDADQNNESMSDFSEQRKAFTQLDDKKKQLHPHCLSSSISSSNTTLQSSKLENIAEDPLYFT